jgi:Na+/H+-dicarboxylate symporter
LFDNNNNNSKYQSIFYYTLAVLTANIVQGIIVLPILLKLKKISPWKLAKGMFPAINLAFFSKSSNATLPLALENAIDNVGISPKIANFTFPLCTTINMNGCAAFILITTLFVGTINGHIFNPTDYVLWIFIATLAAVGNAGVPMGCFFLSSAILSGMGIPLEVMGLILPLYSLIDMVETSLNVWSDSCVTAIVDKEARLLPDLAATQS